MKGSLTIEASLIVPVVVMVMLFAITSGITLYEETKDITEELENRETFDVVKTMYRFDGLSNIEEIFHGD